MSARIKYNDYPLDEVAAQAQEVLAKHPTALVYQKFTCAGCGARQTMETPNEFHTSGICEECQHVTDIKARGCNTTIHYRTTGAGAVDILQSMMKGKPR